MESVRTRRKLIGRCGKGRGTMTEGRTGLNWMELCGTGQNATGQGMTGWDMVKMDGTEWDQRGNWIERNWTAEYGTGRDATEGGKSRITYPLFRIDT